MSEESPICEECSGHVRITEPGDFGDWFCDNPECKWHGRNQAPRFRNINYIEQEFFADGRVSTFRRGRESPGEDNVPAVADSLVRQIGNGYAWEHTSGKERGADFVLKFPDDINRDVQVVRAVDQKFCEKLARDPKHQASSTEYASRFWKRAAIAIRKKSTRTPKDSRAEGILAIDAIDVDFALCWHTWADAQTCTKALARHYGWRDVFVVGQNKLWRLTADESR